MRCGPGRLVRTVWYERVFKRTERSTFCTLIPSGTVSWAGAKFRMAVTPPSTRRSATDWAAVAGTATTAILTFLRRTVWTSFAISTIGTSPTTCPTLAGSASKAMPILNPRA
ncbi:MAG: hypothetical protein MZV64_27900 [Ignavibacteriales bacterium]|nr:hypothetical protein [Ignavibacteriales bacterium]